MMSKLCVNVVEQVAVADIEKQQLESLVEEQREAVRVAAVANVEHGLTVSTYYIGMYHFIIVTVVSCYLGSVTRDCCKSKQG